MKIKKTTKKLRIFVLILMILISTPIPQSIIDTGNLDEEDVEEVDYDDYITDEDGFTYNPDHVVDTTPKSSEYLASDAQVTTTSTATTKFKELTTTVALTAIEYYWQGRSTTPSGSSTYLYINGVSKVGMNTITNSYTVKSGTWTESWPAGTKLQMYMRSWTGGYTAYGRYFRMTTVQAPPPAPSAPTIKYPDTYGGMPTMEWTLPVGYGLTNGLIYWDTTPSATSPYGYRYMGDGTTHEYKLDPATDEGSMDSPLGPGLYYFATRAFNAAGWSGFSAWTPVRFSNPNNPQNVVVEENPCYDGTSTITWDEPDPLLDGLVGKWDFNGNADDFFGTSDGSVNGATLTTDRFGNIDSAYDFDGDNDYIDCGSASDIDLDGNSFSISGWFYSHDLATRLYVTKGTATTRSYLHFGIRDSDNMATLAFYGDDLHGATILSVNTWYHITGIYDTTTNTQKLYLNGELERSRISGGDLSGSNAYSLQIGKYSTIYSDGYIDDVRIYNRVLTSSEILALMGNEISSDESSLVAHWKFDGNTDDSIGGYNGTNAGAILTTDRFGNLDSAYDFDGSDIIDIPFSTLSQCVSNNEISIAFWEKLDTLTSNAILWLEDSNGRIVNVHLPYAPNENIYFDCGVDGVGYDRINKLMPDFIGDWHHWVFTKDVSTGEMKIFFDGQLWHSDISKTKSLTIPTIAASIGNTFDGKIDDVKLYSSAISDKTVSELYFTGSHWKLDGLGEHDYKVNSSGDAIEGIVDWGTYDDPDLSDWTDESDVDCDVSIVDEIYGHNNVMKFNDGSSSGAAKNNLDFTPVTSGTIAFQIAATDVTNLGQIVFYDDVGGYCTFLRINGDKFQYRASGGAMIDVMDVIDNIFYTVEFIFDCSSDTFTLYIDSILIVEDIAFYVNKDNVARIKMETDSTSTVIYYFDTIGFSWDGYVSETNIVYDIVGDNDGIIYGGATSTTDRFDNADSAYDFDGDNDYIDMPFGDGINTGTTAFSLTMWVKADSPETDLMYASFGTNVDNARLYLGHWGSDWDMGIYTSGWGSAGFDTTATTDWTHIGIVMNPSSLTATLYVDGYFAGSKSFSAYSLRANLKIGAYGNNGFEWDGKIDDVKFYNYALSQNDVERSHDTSYTLYEATTYDGSYSSIETDIQSSILTTSFDITKTEAMTRYYKIKAISTIGSSDYSDYEEIEWVAPDTPIVSEPTVQVVYNHDSFSVIRGAVDGSIDTFDWEISIDSGAYADWSSSSDSTLYYDPSAEEHTYQFRLRIQDSNVGIWSEYGTSEIVTISFPNTPDTPTCNSPQYTTPISITWNDTLPIGADEVYLQYSTNDVDFFDISGATTSPTLYDVIEDTYYFRVRATNDVGTSNSSSITVVVDVPGTPNTPTCDSPQYTTPIEIFWNDTLPTGATEVNLQYSTNDIDFYDISEATTNSTFYDVSEGTYYFRVRATSLTSLIGTVYSSSHSVVVSLPTDPGAPTCPSPDFDGDLTITWVAGTGADSAILQISTDGVHFEDVSGATSSPTTILNLEEGSYWFKVNSTNEIGSTNSTYSSEIIVSNPAPTIEFTDGFDIEHGNSTYLNFTITDTTVKSTIYNLTYSYNGGANITIWNNYAWISGTEISYNFNISLYGANIGEYNFYVIANDAVDHINKTTIENYTITVLNADYPYFSNIVYSNFEYNTADQEFTWVGIDSSTNNPYYKIEYSKDGGAIQTPVSSQSWVSGEQNSFDLEFIKNALGAYNFTITMYDGFTKSNSTNFFINVTNLVYPTYSNLIYDDFEATELGHNFSWTITDESTNNPTYKIEYSKDGGSTSTLIESIIWTSESSYYYDLDFIRNVLGDYEFNITSFDGLGNENSTIFTISVLNTNTPSLDLAAYNNVEYSFDLEISWNVSDDTKYNQNYSVFYILNEETTYLYQELTWENGTYSFYLSDFNINLIIGEYEFNITVNDGLGKTNSTVFELNITNLVLPSFIDLLYEDFEYYSTGYEISFKLTDVSINSTENYYKIEYTYNGGTTQTAVAWSDWVNNSVNTLNLDFIREALGLYEFNITAYDGVSNENSTIFNVNVTNFIMPSFVDLTYIDVEYKNTGYSVSWINTDFSFNTSRYYKVDYAKSGDSPTTLIASQLWNNNTVNLFSVDFINEVFGIYEFNITTYDGLGGYNLTTFYIEVVNEIAPSIIGISSFTTAEYSLDFVLVWYIHDISSSGQYYTLNRSVDSVETTLLNEAWINPDRTQDGINSFYFINFQYSIALYNFTLYVYDGVGLSTNITFYVNVTDSLVPEITFLNDTHVIETNAEFELEWLIEDESADSATYDLDYKKNDSSVQNIRNDAAWLSGDIFSFQISELNFVNETYNITFYVVAFDGLELTLNASFFIFISNGIPIITCNVSTSALEYGEITDFNVVVYDPSINITSIIVSYVKNETYTELLNSTWVSEEEFIFTDLNLSLGIYDFNINVSDGNEYANKSFTYDIVNELAPTISLGLYDDIIDIENITKFITELQWTISDISQLEGSYTFYYKIDGKTTYVSIDESLEDSYDFSLVSNNLTLESQKIYFTIIAEDGLGLSTTLKFDITVSDEEIIEEEEYIPEDYSVALILVWLFIIIVVIGLIIYKIRERRE